jgi:uncharacterized protein
MTRYLAVLFCLFIGLGTARAETAPACTGIDLLAKLKFEHPADYAEVMAEAKAVPNNEAIFWKIERSGVAVSYLLGTAHVTDDRVTTLRPDVEMSLLNADEVAFELKEVADRGQMALAALGLARYMVLPAGKSLWDMIPDDQETLIRDNPNLAPGTVGSYFGYQPWVVATALSLPLCETLRAKNGAMPLDMKLAFLAKEKGIPIHGLETPEEQFAVLAGMPLDQQLDYLMSVARNAALIPDQFETLISLYQQRRITAMIPLMLKTQPMTGKDKQIFAYVESVLIEKRNHRMAERALPLLQKGNVFIAVGALHLPGNEGLVELLRAAGYKVTAIN